MTEVTIPIKYPVVSNPKILGGIPVIQGTRIPASLIFDLLQRGYTPDIIEHEYPSISQRKLSAFYTLMAQSFNVPSPKTV